jgi:hypothetical protein
MLDILVATRPCLYSAHKQPDTLYQMPPPCFLFPHSSGRPSTTLGFQDDLIQCPYNTMLVLLCGSSLQQLQVRNCDTFSSLEAGDRSDRSTLIPGQDAHQWVIQSKSRSLSLRTAPCAVAGVLSCSCVHTPCKLKKLEYGIESCTFWSSFNFVRGDVHKPVRFIVIGNRSPGTFHDRISLSVSVESGHRCLNEQQGTAVLAMNAPAVVNSLHILNLTINFNKAKPGWKQSSACCTRALTGCDESAAEVTIALLSRILPCNALCNKPTLPGSTACAVAIIPLALWYKPASMRPFAWDSMCEAAAAVCVHWLTVSVVTSWFPWCMMASEAV